MKLYECNFCDDTKTTFITDDFFNPLSGYTGIAFRGNLSYFKKVGLVVPVIIAGMESNQYGYWCDYSGYCTMTELKSFLCKKDNALDVKKNPEGLGWIDEILSALSMLDKTEENINLYRRFNRKYMLHTQGTIEYQTYGKYWKDLFLHGFLLECTLLENN